MEGLKMGIQNFSENVVLVDLPFKEPEIAEDLKHINEIISNRNDRDVIIDFFRAELINSTLLLTDYGEYRHEATKIYKKTDQKRTSGNRKFVSQRA